MSLRTRPFALCSLLVSLPLLSPSAYAGDWWVDAVNGHNANGGTSESDAWRSITHSLAQLGPLPGNEQDVLHVMPGEYREINGEVFPLELRDRIWLVGEKGPDVTILVGGLRVGIGDEPTGPETGAEGLTLRAKLGQDRGVQIQSVLPVHPVRKATFRHLRIDAFPIGVFAFVKDSSSSGSSLTIEDSQIVRCWQPVAASALKKARFDLTLRRVTIEESGTIELTARNHGELDFLLDRSSIRITQFLFQGVRGVGSLAGGHLRTTFRDSEITAFCLSTTGMVIDGEVLIERCTITGHDSGLFVVGTLPTTLRDSIIWGNAEDFGFTSGSTPTVENCVIDHRDYTGSNGNFSAPPLWVDPSIGDYRLMFGSPCVDLLPASRDLDLGGRPRFIDGDLDTQDGRDIGPRELRLLEGPASANLGDTITFQVQGPPGGAAWLLLSSEAPMQKPIFGSLGRQWLRPGTFAVAARAMIGGPRGTAMDVDLPSDPSLAGTTLGLQALLYSSSAPFGAAWSEPVTLELN